MAKLRKKGIFYLLEGDEARRLSAPLGLKCTLVGAGFSLRNGMRTLKGAATCAATMYMGEDVEIVINGEVVEEIRTVKNGEV